MKRFLVIVDAQNDFICGKLANKTAEERVPNIVRLIEEGNFDKIYVTLDTHDEHYMETKEGQKLPVPHCIEGTWGHEIDDNIKFHLQGKNFKTVKKITFGTNHLPSTILHDNYDDIVENPEIEIVMCGFCTDICVVSNAMILKTAFSNAADITVISDACAGVTPETHEAALTTMKSCQIDVKTLNEYLND